MTASLERKGCSGGINFERLEDHFHKLKREQRYDDLVDFALEHYDAYHLSTVEFFKRIPNHQLGYHYLEKLGVTFS